MRPGGGAARQRRAGGARRAQQVPGPRRQARGHRALAATTRPSSRTSSDDGLLEVARALAAAHRRAARRRRRGRDPHRQPRRRRRRLAGRTRTRSSSPRPWCRRCCWTSSLEFERFRNRYGGCVLCAEMGAAGDAAGARGADYVAWVPAAPRFAGELWLAPAEHAGRRPRRGPAAAGRRPAARASRRRRRHRRRAAQPLAPHGAGRPARPLPLARGDRARVAAASPASSSAPTSASCRSTRKLGRRLRGALPD